MGSDNYYKVLASADETFNEEWEVLSDTFSVLSLDSFMLDNVDSKVTSMSYARAASDTGDQKNASVPTALSKNIAPKQTNKSILQKAPRGDNGSSRFEGNFLGHNSHKTRDDHAIQRNCEEQHTERQLRRGRKHVEKNHQRQECEFCPMNCSVGEAMDKDICHTEQGLLDQDTIQLLLWIDDDFTPQTAKNADK